MYFQLNYDSVMYPFKKLTLKEHLLEKQILASWWLRYKKGRKFGLVAVQILIFSSWAVVFNKDSSGCDFSQLAKKKIFKACMIIPTDHL